MFSGSNPRNLRYFAFALSVGIELCRIPVIFASPPTHPSCDELRDLITRSVGYTSTDISVAEKLAQIIPPETRAVFINEIHEDADAVNHEAEIVTALRKVGYDCLFIEMPEGFDVFSKLRPTENGMILAKSELQAKSNQYQYWPFRLENGWLQAAYAAKQAGATDMKVYEFDQFERKTTIRGLAERNATMMRHLTKAFKSGRCNKAIAINGAWHVVLNTPDGKLHSLPSLAEKNGIQPYTLTLRSRDIEKQVPLLSKTCDYTKIGNEKPYIVHEKSTIDDLLKEALALEYDDEFLPIRLNGSHAIVVY